MRDVLTDGRHNKPRADFLISLVAGEAVFMHRVEECGDEGLQDRPNIGDCATGQLTLIALFEIGAFLHLRLDGIRRDAGLFLGRRFPVRSFGMRRSHEIL